ncbi:MAG: YbfB/YjiJ family MFS transporter [Rubrivivax sp.]|nr:MAG: YbfB/YjiJ family MFS transporter [Rubrivivax sp.]
MTTRPLGPWRVAIAGILCLATAMGIGRFAFTPLLPMLLQQNLVDLTGAGWLASANYIGYLVGALLCTVQPWLWQRLQGVRPLPALEPTVAVRCGLVATCVLTLGMAVYWQPAWPLLRFAAGVASAFVFIYISGWCLGQMARMGVPAMGALIYTGPGIGIVVSGVAASGMLAWHWPAWAGWLAFGLLAMVLTTLVWPTLSWRAPQAAAPAAATTTAPAVAPPADSSARHGPTELATLTVAYGLAGFGYIITATFLPVIARQVMPASPWLDLFWPLFGAGVIGGALVASRLKVAVDLRMLLAVCYGVQALGVAAGLVAPNLAGFAIGSLLLGLPFTAITFFAMQEVRRVRPRAASAYMGLLTATYGIGQIVGPPMASALLARSVSARAGFDLSLEIAAGSLVLGAALYVFMVRRWPARDRA